MAGVRRRWGWIGAAALWGLTLSGTALQAQMGAPPIYQGDSTRQTGLTLAPWGSGEVRESQEHILTGNNSLRIVTHGMFQGARLIPQKPVDMKPALADPALYLRLSFLLPDRESMGTPRMGAGFGGFMSGPPPGIGSGRRFGGGLGSERGGEGMMGSARVVKPKAMEYVRLVLVTTDNKRIEKLFRIEDARVNAENWRLMAFPVASLPGLKESSGEVKEIQIFGDAPGILYLGEIRTVRDETPIRVNPFPERTVAVNDTVTLTASAEAGQSPLIYQWTIARKEEADQMTGDNLPVDIEGRTFRHQFRKSGDYVVILTVRDVYGLKKPAQTRVNIRVSI